MTEAPNTGRHLFAVGLVVVGILILVGLAAFVTIALGFRQSFTSSFTPVEDMAAAFAVLAPVVIVALLLIGYGRRLLRKE